jgi:hypothetical protein
MCPRPCRTHRAAKAKQQKPAAAAAAVAAEGADTAAGVDSDGGSEDFDAEAAEYERRPRAAEKQQKGPSTQVCLRCTLYALVMCWLWKGVRCTLYAPLMQKRVLPSVCVGYADAVHCTLYVPVNNHASAALCMHQSCNSVQNVRHD